MARCAVIGLVLVGHSPELVRGLAAMLRQAAPGVEVRTAAGTASGALGTAAPAVVEAMLGILVSGVEGAVVLLDINSAALAVEMALEEVGPEAAGRFRTSRGPLVEGALCAAIAAAGGGSLEDVLRASQEVPVKLPADWPSDGRSPAGAGQADRPPRTSE